MKASKRAFGLEWEGRILLFTACREEHQCQKWEKNLEFHKEALNGPHIFRIPSKTRDVIGKIPANGLWQCSWGIFISYGLGLPFEWNHER